MGHKLFDQYSLLHFSVGVIGYFFGIDFYLFVLINILFEIVENSSMGVSFINQYLGNIWPGGKNGSDTIINSISDIFFCIIGWLSGYYLDKISNYYGWH